MSYKVEPITILQADANPEDGIFTRGALAEIRLAKDPCFVNEGEGLVECVYRREKFSSPATSPRSGVVLFDLNMSKPSGHQVLQKIKADPLLRQTPVVVLTTSKTEENVFRSYDLRANSYYIRPAALRGLVEALRSLGSIGLPA